MKSMHLVALVVLFVLLPWQGWSQTEPALTEVQRLTIQNLSQQLEIAQLKAQAAQRDFDAARASIATLVKNLQVPGYTLDLNTLSYSPIPTEEKK